MKIECPVKLQKKELCKLIHASVQYIGFVPTPDGWTMISQGLEDADVIELLRGIMVNLLAPNKIITHEVH